MYSEFTRMTKTSLFMIALLLMNMGVAMAQDSQRVHGFDIRTFYDDLNESIHLRTPDQKAFHIQILNFFAPKIFQEVEAIDVVCEQNGEVSLIHPADMIMYYNFTERGDLRFNAAHFFKSTGAGRVDFPLRLDVDKLKANGVMQELSIEAKIPAFVIESESHFYLVYMIYHVAGKHKNEWRSAAGGQKDSYDNQVSTILTVIEKSNEFIDQLESDGLYSVDLIRFLNHDFSVVGRDQSVRYYSPDSRREAQLNRAAAARYTLIQRLNLRQDVSLSDPQAKGHQDAFPSSYVGYTWSDDGWVQDAGLMAFITKESHSIYKANPDLFSLEHDGFVYICEAYREVYQSSYGQILERPIEIDGQADSYPIPAPQDRVVSFRIVDLLGDLEAHHATARDSRFVGNLESAETLVTLEGVHRVFLRTRRDFPAYLASARSEGSSESSALPFQWKAMTSYPLALIHMVHQEMEPEDRPRRVSEIYIYNPFVEYTP